MDAHGCNRDRIFGHDFYIVFTDWANEFLVSVCRLRVVDSIPFHFWVLGRAGARSSLVARSRIFIAGAAADSCRIRRDSQ